MLDFRDRLSSDLEDLSRQSLLRRRRTVQASHNGWCTVDGKRLRDFASNDYLNLSRDPRLIAAAKGAMDEFGVGSRASAQIIGRTEWHARLEKDLAEFEGQEAAILFPTGYAANSGTISALVDQKDIVFCDRLNHASLIDGCRLSKARIRVYRHNDLSVLERELKKAGSFQHRWIVTDGVFGMDGDLAPLVDLCELAERFAAELIVDEAHATGVYGNHGRGAAEWLGVEEKIAVRIGTLSKAIGALGGFVTGGKTLIDWLWNHARSNVYSTALPPAVCAAASMAIGIIRDEPQRRQKLLALSSMLRDLLSRSDLQIPDNCHGPIVPVIVGDSDRAIYAGEQLESRGHLVAVIRPPTVPTETARLRISLTSAHTETDVEQLARAVADVLS